MVTKGNHQELIDADCLSLPGLLPSPMGHRGNHRWWCGVFQREWVTLGTHRALWHSREGLAVPSKPRLPLCLALLCWLAP